MEKEFVDGMRAYKPHQNAPDFVKADIEIDIAELSRWLTGRDNKVRLSLKEARSGNYYLEVNTFKPKQENRGYDVPPNDGFPPPDDFDDDLPF